MTFCKVLKQSTIGPDTVTAYENYDKFCSVPYYEIVVSRDGIGYQVEKTAKTTWRRKFKEMTANA